MELNSFDGKLSVAQAHDRAGTILFGGPGADFEICRKGFFFHDQRVVASRRHGRGQTGKNRFAVVGDRAGFAVHKMRGANDVAAECRADGLVPEANAENGHFAGEVPNQINTDARLLRRAGAGGNHDAPGSHFLELGDGDLIIAANFNLGAQFSEILNQVVGKRVVVVENEDHGAGSLQ